MTLFLLSHCLKNYLHSNHWQFQPKQKVSIFKIFFRSSWRNLDSIEVQIESMVSKYLALRTCSLSLSSDGAMLDSLIKSPNTAGIALRLFCKVSSLVSSWLRMFIHFLWLFSKYSSVFFPSRNILALANDV